MVTLQHYGTGLNWTELYWLFTSCVGISSELEANDPNEWVVIKGNLSLALYLTDAQQTVIFVTN